LTARGVRKAATAKKHALVVMLTGDLGAGKTTFIQGFLRGAGIQRRAPSPTFVIMRHYKLPRRPAKPWPFVSIHHMDAYRLKAGEEKGQPQLAALGFDDLVKDPANLILIEWGERIAKALPREAIKITFGYGKKEGERKITITRPASYL